MNDDYIATMDPFPNNGGKAWHQLNLYEVKTPYGLIYVFETSFDEAKKHVVEYAREKCSASFEVYEIKLLAHPQVADISQQKVGWIL